MPTKAPRPIPAVTTWTGCYIGANVGGGSARERYIDPLAVPPDALGSHDATGVIGGGQIGCDWQTGAWVFGAQGLVDGSGMRGSHFSPVAADFFKTRIPWFATATVRAGYLLQPSLLAYVRGGAAWKRDEEQVLDGVTGVLEAFARTTRTGWTVGGGFEYMIAPGWSAFVEGDYLGFGSRNITFTALPEPGDPAPVPFPLNIRENVFVAMAGLNYRFNWAGPVAARY
jgi:outer membrane immunogenic protein